MVDERYDHLMDVLLTAIAATAAGHAPTREPTA
jgi:hypothetical protein